MIVCTNCGYQNEDGARFCGSCRGFLEFVGEPRAAEETSGQSAPPTQPDSDSDADVSLPAATPVGSTASHVDQPAAGSASTVIGERSTAEPTRRPSGPIDAAERSSGLGNRPAAGSNPPLVRQPVAMKPVEVTESPPSPRPVAPVPDVRPGDLICGQCGVGNLADRRFCRRCGQPLADAATAPEPPKPPWWHRFLQRLRRKPVVLAAGERPEHHRARQARDARRSMGRRTASAMRGFALRVVAFLAMAGIALTFVGPWKDNIQDGIGDVKDRIRQAVAPRFVLVNALRAEAPSASLPGHPPALLIDMKTNTYWAEGVRGVGEGQAVVFTFASGFDLDKVRFYSGANSQPGEFAKQPRPKDVHLVFSDGTSKDITLNDSAKPQVFDIGAMAVDRVELRIVSVYPSAEGTACSISELEFLTKQ